jgi:hypothetical protein
MQAKVDGGDVLACMRRLRDTRIRSYIDSLSSQQFLGILYANQGKLKQAEESATLTSPLPLGSYAH